MLGRECLFAWEEEQNDNFVTLLNSYKRGYVVHELYYSFQREEGSRNIKGDYDVVKCLWYFCWKLMIDNV